MTAIGAGIRQRFNDDAPILCALVSSWVFVTLFLSHEGIRGLRWAPCIENLQLYLLAVAVVAVVIGVRRLKRDRPTSPVRYLGDTVSKPTFVIELVGGLPMLAAMVLYVPIFSAVKSAIPRVEGYAWDATLIAADRMILGTDAWRVLQPLVGFLLLTSALSFAYHAWVVLIYGGGAYFCFFVQDRELRAQYFIARFLSWIVMGMILATAFASVGPCFVGPILGNHHFDAQAAYLKMANTHFPVLVLPVQHQLLMWFEAGRQDLGAGISAMPSMHIGMTTLTLLAVRRVSRRAGHLMFGFLLVIIVGSVHLGYHYAMDGIVALVGTTLLWLAAGALAHRITMSDAALRGAAPVASATSPAAA
jgi:hypothetical protein